MSEMAGGEDQASLCFVKALNAFVENGRALLDLAENDSKKGWQHFMRQTSVKIDMPTPCSTLGEHFMVVHMCRAGVLSIIWDDKWSQTDLLYTRVSLKSNVFHLTGSLQEFIRQSIRIEQNQSLLGLIEAGAALYRRSGALPLNEKLPNNVTVKNLFIICIIYHNLDVWVLIAPYF